MADVTYLSRPVKDSITLPGIDAPFVGSLSDNNEAADLGNSLVTRKGVDLITESYR